MDRQATRRLDDMTVLVEDLTRRVQALEKLTCAPPAPQPRAVLDKPARAALESRSEAAARKIRAKGTPPGVSPVKGDDE